MKEPKDNARGKRRTAENARRLHDWLYDAAVKEAALGINAELQPGQVRTSIRTLASELAMTEKELRTAFSRLTDKGGITVLASKTGTVVSIVGFGENSTQNDTPSENGTQNPRQWGQNDTPAAIPPHTPPITTHQVQGVMGSNQSTTNEQVATHQEQGIASSHSSTTNDEGRTTNKKNENASSSFLYIIPPTPNSTPQPNEGQDRRGDGLAEGRGSDKGPTRPSAVPTRAEVLAYAREIGAEDAQPDYFWLLNEAGGWQVEGNPIRNWRVFFVRWVQTERESRRSETRLHPDMFPSNAHEALAETYGLPRRTASGPSPTPPGRPHEPWQPTNEVCRYYWVEGPGEGAVERQTALLKAEMEKIIGGPLIVDDMNREAINQIGAWLARDPRGALDFNKSLWIAGSLYSGKRTLAKAVRNVMYDTWSGDGNKDYMLRFSPGDRFHCETMNAEELVDLRSVSENDWIVPSSAWCNSVCGKNLFLGLNLGSEKGPAVWRGTKVDAVKEFIRCRSGYGRLAYTIMTSYLPSAAVAEKYGDDVVARILSFCNVVNLGRVVRERKEDYGF